MTTIYFVRQGEMIHGAWSDRARAEAQADHLNQHRTKKTGRSAARVDSCPVMDGQEPAVSEPSEGEPKPELAPGMRRIIRIKRAQPELKEQVEDFLSSEAPPDGQ